MKLYKYTDISNNKPQVEEFEVIEETDKHWKIEVPAEVWDEERCMLVPSTKLKRIGKSTKSKFAHPSTDEAYTHAIADSLASAKGIVLGYRKTQKNIKELRKKSEFMREASERAFYRGFYRALIPSRIIDPESRERLIQSFVDKGNDLSFDFKPVSELKSLISEWVRSLGGCSPSLYDMKSFITGAWKTDLPF